MPTKKLNKSFPLVSIVIPCYNAEDFIKSCMRSVLKTTYPNYEIIIVDDMSTDGTYEYIKKTYSHNKKIILVRNQKNSGPSVTRNHGIKIAKGEYVAFIETDME